MKKIIFIFIVAAALTSCNSKPKNVSPRSFPIRIVDGRTYYFHNSIGGYSYLSPTYETLVAAAEEAFWNVEVRKTIEASGTYEESLQLLIECHKKLQLLLEKHRELYGER